MLLQIRPRSRANPVAIFGNRSKALVRCQEIFVSRESNEKVRQQENERGVRKGVRSMELEMAGRQNS